MKILAVDEKVYVVLMKHHAGEIDPETEPIDISSDEKENG